MTSGIILDADDIWKTAWSAETINRGCGHNSVKPYESESEADPGI